MANEFQHISTVTGTRLKRTDWEDIDVHRFDSQATGDLMYASSVTQLSRLAAGTQGYPLIMGASLPQWGGAQVWNGAVNAGNQAMTNVAGISLTAGSSNLYCTANNNLVFLYGGAAAAGKGARIALYGVDTGGANGLFLLHTPDAAGTANVERLRITGKLARALSTWSNVDQTFGAAYLELTEMVAPGAGAANTARIYALEDGGGLTDLCAVFQDGSIDVFAQEVTPLDSPIFTSPSQTEIKLIMEKPHPGLIRFMAKYPNGKVFPLREIQYHDAEKIAANKGCEGILPIGWEVSTLQERIDGNIALIDEKLGELSVSLAELENEQKDVPEEERQISILDEIEQVEQDRIALEEKKQIELARIN